MTRLIIVCGLPGTGKTTFAETLSKRIHAIHLNTDRIRHAIGRQGQYSIALKATIYESLLLRSKEALFNKTNVILDGTFYKKRFRRAFIRLSNQLHIPIHWIEIVASEQSIRERVSKKRPYTEADYQVYLKVKNEFDPLPHERLILDSDVHSVEEMVRLAERYLHLPELTQR
jgi:predicted kinase